jgi:hypothetical protein
LDAFVETAQVGIIVPDKYTKDGTHEPFAQLLLVITLHQLPLMQGRQWALPPDFAETFFELCEKFIQRIRVRNMLLPLKLRLISPGVLPRGHRFRGENAEAE